MTDRLIDPPAIHGEAQAGRAATVRKEIESLKNSMSSSRWELASLLSEARDKQYHHEWGFTDFEQYIENSNFDISSREAQYLIKIHNNSATLGIMRSQLQKVAISKLKEIFKLDPKTHADDIKRLVTVAEKAPLDHIKAEVRRLQGLAGLPEMTFVNLYVSKESADTIIRPALEEAKLEAGPAEDAEGNSQDITDGRAAEYICTEWMQDPNRARNNMGEIPGDDECQ